MNRFEATLIVLMAAVVPAVAQDTNGDMVIQGKPGDAGELSLSIANEARAALDALRLKAVAAQWPGA